MRQLTAYASYVDNLGALLIGRARFFNTDGSPADVKALDDQGNYVTAGNIVYTNSSGQLTPQVFLEDHDYLIVFDKYVGGGTMSEDDDPESWQEQGSAIDRYNTLGVELEGSAVRSISTIDDLRSSMPLEQREVVMLMGYNVSGDKDPVYYRWNPNATGQDDGGSVIKVASQEQGRWTLFSCPEYLDVRHFGAFPLQTIAADSNQRYAIQKARTWAYANGSGIYFYATPLAKYFDVSGLTLVKVDSHPRAKVFCVSGMTSSISEIKNVHCANAENVTGQIVLTSETVRTSWTGGLSSVVCSPSSKLVMDGPVTGGSWSGIAVDIESYSSGCTFDGCKITSVGKIDSSVTIQNCELKSEWFASDYNWNSLNILSNTISLKNCKDANTYILLKNKQNESNYGDLEENEISGVRLLAGCILENARFTDVTLAGNSELHNVDGNVLIVGDTPTCNWIDCWITVTSVTNGIGSLQFRRGEISSSSPLTLVMPSTLVDVSINTELTCNSDLKLDRCTINGPVAGLRLKATRNDVFSTLKILMESGVLSANVNCNRFFENGYLAVIPLAVAPGVTAVATLDISVTGNYSDHDFWDDSAFSGVPHITVGKIVYDGNYGGCPGNRAVDCAVLTMSTRVPEQTWGAVTSLPYGQPENTLWFIKDNRRSGSDNDQRQFWWSAKVVHSHNTDTLKIWRCKNLNYNRRVFVRTVIAGEYEANSGAEEVCFSRSLRGVYINAGPSGHTMSQSKTYTFQEVSGASYAENGNWHQSRLALLSLSSPLAAIEWTYEAT